ncbi:MAG: DUF368 domain-containing protein [Planctomycetota bacterium]|nr:DUF368 domain-containing protein [Planctomycetota bacterium]
MTDQQPASPPLGRTFLGGVLMGLANLVPGISGGTMILAVGLYERFIGAVADVSRLRITRASVIFLGVLGVGLSIAVLTLSGVAVGLVADHRWVMYSLFIGLTLGGVPELLRLTRPIGAPAVSAFLAGMAGMAALAWGLSGTSLPVNMGVLVLVGAAAASSMILPGVSGSYVLLIVGMYDTVIGSLSATELRADFTGSIKIIGPVIVGAVIGIALLSNLLKALLARWSSASHGALLGLLCGSVFGLFPFQDAVHPELAQRSTRKAIEALVLEEATNDEVRGARGDDLADEDLDAYRAAWSGKTKGELKQASLRLERFAPAAGQIAAAIGLLLVGFAATRALGKGSRDQPTDG